MKVHQLSVFLENQPGQLRSACEVLTDASVNILALSLADTSQFGILRLIVKDWRCGKTVLEKSGFVVNVTEVLSVDVEDRPGALVEILRVADDARLAIEYMYAFSGGRTGKATLIFRFAYPDAAIAALGAAQVNLVAAAELFARAGA